MAVLEIDDHVIRVRAVDDGGVANGTTGERALKTIEEGLKSKREEHGGESASLFDAAESGKRGAEGAVNTDDGGRVLVHTVDGMPKGGGETKGGKGVSDSPTRE